MELNCFGFASIKTPKPFISVKARVGLQPHDEPTCKCAAFVFHGDGESDGVTLSDIFFWRIVKAFNDEIRGLGGVVDGLFQKVVRLVRFVHLSVGVKDDLDFALIARRHTPPKFNNAFGGSISEGKVSPIVRAHGDIVHDNLNGDNAEEIASPFLADANSDLNLFAHRSVCWDNLNINGS